MSLLSAAGLPDVHPPLFYWVLRVWGFHSEAWCRSLSVLASLVSLGLCYRLWRRLDVVFLLAVGFAELQQARELRMYSWLEMWALAYFVCLTEGRRVLAAFALLAACFTHLFGLFLVPLGGRRLTWAVLPLWLFWAVPHYVAQLGHPLGLRQAPSVLMAVEAVGRLVGGRVCPFGDTFSVGLGLLVLGWLAYRRPECPRWVWGWALGPWLTLFLVSWLTPLQLFEFKYLTWTSPAWAMLLVSSVPWRGLGPAWLFLNLWGFVPWLLHPGWWMADWRGVAEWLRARRGPPVQVHPSMMAAPLLFYYGGPETMQPVDEWKQVRPGGPILWVTTPHHPFVRMQRLEIGLRRYWRLREQHEFASFLPSSVVWVGWWEWKGAPPGGEKQPGR